MLDNKYDLISIQREYIKQVSNFDDLKCLIIDERV